MTEKSTTTSRKRLEARIGKVLSHHQNRGGFSTALAYTPDDSREQAHGSLYFVIDIGSPSPLSADIAYNLIDIVKDEFYADLDKSPEKSFESALKAANEELEAIYKGGERDWVGKFNAVIAAVSGRDIMIVQRGTAEVHLVRGGQMTNLSRGMYTPGETYRPEETLINMLEGEVDLGDKVLFSTSELFYYISIEKLKRLVEGNSPATAAKKLATMLEQEEAINRTSVLVSEFNLPELIHQDEETEPVENWVGEPSAPAPRPKKMEVVEDKVDKEQSVAEAIQSTPSEVATNNYQSQEVEEDEQLSNQIDVGASINVAKQGLSKLGKNINFGDYKSKLKLDNAQVNKVLSITGKVFGAIWLVIAEVYKAASKLIGGLVADIRKRPNGNKILMGVGIGVAAAILIIGGLTVSAFSGRSASREAQVALTEAQQKRDEAQTALIYEDTAKARVLLGEAFLAAQTASNNQRTQGQAAALMAELQNQLDSINGVKRFLDIQPLGDFSTLNSQLGEGKSVDVNRSTIFNSNVFATDGSNNKIYRYNVASGEMVIANSLVSSDRSLKLLAPFNEDQIMFYTSPPNVYSLNLTTNSLAGIALDTGNWNNADKIVSYAERLYFLDSENNQIWKYQTVPEGFTPIAPYFDPGSGVDLSGALDFAIDGNVYTLQPNNVVKKFTGGVAADFTLQAIPQPYKPLGNVTKIFADNETNLYLLDEANNRVVVYDPDGNYLSQFIYGDSISGINSLNVNQEAGYIYLTTASLVYRLPMN